jgi:hypothetical protein
MVNRQVLIGKVSPFLGKREIIVGNQDTTDIIDALIKNHYKYQNEYDKIYRFFDGGSVEETAYNVWQFLKDEFKYTIEPEKMQILRSPAAILASNIIGIDCKGYATFANGVMDAYRRNTGKKFDVDYRFASYDAFDKTPQHVFSVIKENGVEYWIDPVLDQFDEKKQPYYFKDKKIKNMALVAMSGIKKRIGDDTVDYSSIDISTSDASLPQDDFSYYSQVDTTVPTGYDQYGNLVNYSGGAEILDSSGNPVSQSTSTSTGSSWFQNIFGSNAESILKAFNKTNTGGYNAGGSGSSAVNPNLLKTPTTSTGISTNTVLLLGAAGLAAYFLLSKKK